MECFVSVFNVQSIIGAIAIGHTHTYVNPFWSCHASSTNIKNNVYIITTITNSDLWQNTLLAVKFVYKSRSILKMYHVKVKQSSIWCHSVDAEKYIYIYRFWARVMVKTWCFFWQLVDMVGSHFGTLEKYVKYCVDICNLPSDWLLSIDCGP